MDNLGEALEIHLGLWPPERPFGSHSSITECLPHVLRILQKHEVKGTYFMESWSLGIYYAQAKEMMGLGHEVAWHAYQHEIWDKLTPDEEQENFAQSVAAASELGVQYAGFRPPGGSASETTFKLLNRHHFKYISPLSDDVNFKSGVCNKDGILVLPFKWRDVDAFYYAPEFTALRQGYGEEGPVMEPGIYKEHLLSKISETLKKGDHLNILFHPFLQTSAERLQVLEDIVERLSNDPEIWLAPCNEVAEWIEGHADSFHLKTI